MKKEELLNRRKEALADIRELLEEHNSKYRLSLMTYDLENLDDIHIDLIENIDGEYFRLAHIKIPYKVI